MKNFITYFIMLVFCGSTFVYGQNDTIWFNSNWQETTKKDASFFRPKVNKKNNGYWIVDYYLAGSKQMEGLSTKKNEEVFDGTVTWFYENGKQHQVVNYKQGTLEGNRKVFYETGELMTEAQYIDGEMDGKWTEYFKNGKVKETGNYEKGQKEGLWKSFYENGKIKEEGKYIFGNKVDIWKTHYYDGLEK